MNTRTLVANPTLGVADGGAPIPDATLVQRAQSGDPDAFSDLVRRHQHMVFNVAYRFMRDTALAEDMAQESFVKAFRLIKGFRGDCSFSTWMYRVTCSVCLTELNRRKRRGEVELGPQHLKELSVGPAENIDLPEHIRRCVSKLPDRYATIITLYYLKGVSYDEIADVLRIPMGTLKTWMFRARKQLRNIVEKELPANAGA
jgi:RNA polymerase sigma-70 factor (ECF subfamily)